jgi:hypothetical protein
LGQSTLVVLCAGSTLLLAPKLRPRQATKTNSLEPSPKPASINLQKWFLSPTGRLNLGFIIEGNLPLCSSYLPLGVPNWAASTANSVPPVIQVFSSVCVSSAKWNYRLGHPASLVVQHVLHRHALPIESSNKDILFCDACQ